MGVLLNKMIMNKKQIVVLANKLTRIAWVIVTKNDEFKANCAFKTA
jgi:hypothetical protein